MKPLKLRIGVLFFIILIFLGGGFLWWKQATSPVNPDDKKSVIFVVNQGDGIREITSGLKKEGLIKDQVAFFLLIKKMGIDQQIQAGDFKLNPAMSAQTIAQTLTRGMLDVWITLPEGWRNEEISLKLAQELSIPETEFLKYAKEGYMFPDTYLIPKESSGAAIAKILQDNFNKKFDNNLRQEAARTGLTIEEAVTLASIVEKEASGESDRNLIAGILLKRLKEDWPLQTDATLQYLSGYQSSEKTWWKKELTDFDKRVKSPFNTYLNLGLPPAPICNPGLASIKAVIYPQESDYWYYLHSPDGQVHFAKTQAEHEANIAKYLR